MIPSDLKRRRTEQRAMAKEKAASRKAIDDGRQDLVSGMLQESSDVSPLEYQSTVETLIIAGSETTATLMSGIIYYLLKEPDKMEKLVSEIRHAFKSAEDINFVSVNGLPYLLACLQETLRVYPPVPDGFPRNTGPRQEIICDRPVPPHVSKT
jgi:cytochrome P450